MDGDRGEALVAGEVVEEDVDAALEASALTVQEAGEGGEEGEGNREGGEAEVEESEEGEEGDGGGPEGQVRGEGPAGAKSGAEGHGSLGRGFSDSEDFESGPAGAGDFEVEGVPAGIGAAGPAVVFEGGEDGGDPVATGESGGGPVGGFADGGTLVDAGFGFE
jgi:hypothetical protein